MVSIPQPEPTNEQNEASKSAVDSSDKLPEQPKTGKKKPLDIVFLQDTTGSQGPYIKAARQAIRGICDKISASAQFPKEFIRFGLIAFRDHPPQDMSYVTKEFGFTSDISQMQKNLTSLIASGGGDGPEAQTAALAAALNLEWNEDAIKIVILITDAPPHGLGENGDGFDKSPDQNDPLDIVRQMAERGLTLFVIACEPSLSQSYRYALDFYSALVQITSGRLLSLLMADKLGDYIIGSAIETIETEQLISEFENVIVDDVYGKSKSIEEVMAELQTMDIENVYEETGQSVKNREAWFSASSLAEARKQVQPRMNVFASPPTPAPYLARPPRYGSPFSFGSAVPSPPPLAPYRSYTSPCTFGSAVPPTPTRVPIFTPFESSVTRSAEIVMEESSEFELDGDDVKEGLVDDGEDSESVLEKRVKVLRAAAEVPPPPLPPSGPPRARAIASPAREMRAPVSGSAPPPLPPGRPILGGGMPLYAGISMWSAMPTCFAAPGAPIPTGSPPAPPQHQPKYSLERTDVSTDQARRLVMRSLTRNSRVTATGLVSKKGDTAGQSVAWSAK